MVCAAWSAGQPAVSKDAQQTAASALSNALKHSQHALAATAAAALGHAGLRGALPLPPPSLASSSVHDDQSSDIVPPSAKRSKSPDGSTAAAGHKGESGVTGAAEAASGAASQAASPDAAAASEQGVMQKIMALTKDKDVKVVQKAATAAGHICAGHAVRANLTPALEGLFALGFNKNEDVLFTVGEALCFAFGGELVKCICTFPNWVVDQTTTEQSVTIRMRGQCVQVFFFSCFLLIFCHYTKTTMDTLHPLLLAGSGFRTSCFCAVRLLQSYSAGVATSSFLIFGSETMFGCFPMLQASPAQRTFWLAH